MVGFERMKTTILLCVLLGLLPSARLNLAEGSSEESKCSASSTSFECPSCGGIEVSDCLDCEGYPQTDLSHNICFQRKLFNQHNDDSDDYENHYHYLWNDLLGAVVWFFVSGIAMACGVGGGGIFVPLGILLFQFAPKPASGLSQSSIFGASLGGLLLNSRNFHPEEKIRDDPGVLDDKKGIPIQKELSPAEEKRYVESQKGIFYTRPVIYYDMAMFLAPMEMAGAVLGVLIQKVLPNWLYLLLAAMVLSFTSYKTYKKFFAVKAQEQKKVEERKQQVSSDQDNDVKKELTEEAHTPIIDAKKEVNGPEDAPEQYKEQENSPPVSETIDPSADNDSSIEEESKRQLRRQYLEEDMVQYPKEKIITLIVLWIGLFVLTLMKGGKGVDSLVGIQCDSPWYAVLIVCQFLWIFGFAVFFARKLEKGQTARIAVDYPYLPNDPVWSRYNLYSYGGATFVAGIVAGFIGIGGGMVLGPLMLVMNVHPRVSAATTAILVVLTSSSVAVMFVTSGLVPWSYAVFYFFVCFGGAIFGKSKIDNYVKKTGKPSVLIFILASIIAFATVGCFVIMILRLAEADWCFEGFNKFCNIHDDKDCPADRLLEFLTDSY